MEEKLLEKFQANGHPNIQGSHKTTLEFTTAKNLTLQGDCIIGVDSQKACFNLSDQLKNILKEKNKFRVKITTDHHKDEFYGYGDPKLSLTHKEDMVFRKSNYICNRTIMIGCSKAAKDIDPLLIDELKNPEKIIKVEIFLVDTIEES